MNRFLWALQILLALLFLFTGVSKLITPVEQMTKQIPLSGGMLHFIAVCEILGAIGLILPRWLGIKPWLTPLAAALLVVIMVGATVLTLQTGAVAVAALPCVTGILCILLAYGRWRLAP